MSSQSANCDELPSPADVVEEAIGNRTSVSDVAGRYARKDKAKNRLVVRVYRYLKRMPGGEKLKKYLLNDGSWHRHAHPRHSGDRGARQGERATAGIYAAVMRSY